MATVTKRDKFFEVLRNIFVGAKIEGNSGYVNLMKIKSRYYNEFKEQLHIDIDAKLKEVGQNFEEELYNKLFTFFKKYFSESGSIYFSYTPLQEKVYERIYRDDKDVMLFWKTHMLYYVKTERLFKNMEVEDEDIIYLFDVAELQHKKSNEKKDLVFELVKAEHTDKRRIHFSVKYSANGSKTKTEEILKKIKKEKAFGSITLKQVERALGIFKRQSEVDYFINKDAKGFLKEQFSLWIKGYLLDDESLFESERLNQLKALQHIAFNVIDLVGQFEDELVKVWNKPKFVHSSNYVITLDKIADKDFALIEKILKHKGITEQIKEWEELGITDKKFDVKEILKGKRINEKYQYLPLDTKHFKVLEIDILSLFEDIDNQLDGWLIHTDNFQGLNNLKKKFQSKVDVVYIDPPYNAPASEIIYTNNYKHSSWITMMENRIELSKYFLKKDGVFECAIDKQEQESLGKLIDKQFPDKEKVCVTIIHNPGGVQGDNFSYTHEYTYFVFPDEKNTIKRVKRDEPNIESLRDWGGEDSKRESAKNCFYPIIVNKDNMILDFGDVCEDEFHPSSSNISLKGGNIAIYPIDQNGIERKWRYARQSVEAIKKQLLCKDDNGIKSIQNVKYFFRVKTVWDDKKYNANTNGSKLLNNIVPNSGFDFPKSLYNVQDCVQIASTDNSLILDFFPGSGTTAHAIMDLNKSAETSKRKFILTELGNHFFTTIIPRIKKITYANNYEKGKAKDSIGLSSFFKYFALEQYEEALTKIKYEDKNSLPTQEIYHQYLFLKDLKLVDDVVKLDEKSKSIKVDLTKLHPAIDIPETLSHLTGKFIKQIKNHEVVFTDGTRIDLTNIDYKIVKPLIWW